MIGSIVRFRPRALRRVGPMMLIVVGAPTAYLDPVHLDPVHRKGSGYAGVLPIPSPAATATATGTNRRLDPLLDPRRDARTERGRVLYAAGHAPRDTAAVPARTKTKVVKKRPCPEERLVQVRTPDGPDYLNL
jgi:hypothetical protein